MKILATTLLLSSLLGLASTADASTYTFRVSAPGIVSAEAAPVVAPPGSVFATWDSSYSPAASYTNGNLSISGGSWFASVATQSKSAGKWYWEVTQSAGTTYLMAGVATSTFPQAAGFTLGDAGSWGYWNKGYRVLNTVAGTSTDFSLSAPAIGDTYMLALDMDNHALYLGKNGVWALAGVPTSGPAKTGSVLYGFSGPLFPATAINSAQSTVNFGATAFTYPVPVGYSPGVYR